MEALHATFQRFDREVKVFLEVFGSMAEPVNREDKHVFAWIVGIDVHGGLDAAAFQIELIACHQQHLSRCTFINGEDGTDLESPSVEEHLVPCFVLVELDTFFGHFSAFHPLAPDVLADFVDGENVPVVGDA